MFATDMALPSDSLWLCS